jgi:hypothetical protein
MAVSRRDQDRRSRAVEGLGLTNEDLRDRGIIRPNQATQFAMGESVKFYVYPLGRIRKDPWIVRGRIVSNNVRSGLTMRVAWKDDVFTIPARYFAECRVYDYEAFNLVEA